MWGGAVRQAEEGESERVGQKVEEIEGAQTVLQ